MRILALDPGDKRIGIAISDPLGITAQGLPTLERKNDDRDFETLKGICGDKGVQKCLVGLPLQMNGDIGERAKITLAWVEKLKAKIPCPVETWDERLTTREATRLMIGQGMSRQKRKDKNDQLAAILLLQNYLETQRSKRPHSPDDEVF